jgi:Tfp pilus assembly protein PilV
MARSSQMNRATRGFGILEIMIASVILSVAVAGFVGAMREAVNATAVAHRRTEATFLRTGLMDRLLVSQRNWLAPPLGPPAGWNLESCYDVDAQPVANNAGVWSANFACPATAAYRRWLQVTDVLDRQNRLQRVWSVSLYVERIDQGCTSASRYQSIGCVAADMLLTD